MPPDPFLPSYSSLSVALRQTLWLLGFGEGATDVEPEALASFVRHHGIAGLLSASRVASCSEAQQGALVKQQQQLIVRALQLSATLRGLLTELAAHQMHPLVLKGPALALQAHGTLAARGGVDLDLLLDEAQWPQALQVLAQLGYAPAANQVLPLPVGTHELVLRHARRAPPVELHRRLLRRRYRFAPKGTVQLDLQGIPMHCLDPTHALPYLVIHANQHSFRRLIWLLDIHALLKHPAFDPTRAARLFVEIGAGGALDTCLGLLSLLFGHDAAPALQSVRRPCTASRTLTRIALNGIEQSLSDDQVAQRYGILHRVMLDIALQDHLPGRWQALCDWLSPTATDIRWLKLPRGLTFLYPPLRLMRLSRRLPQDADKRRKA